MISSTRIIVKKISAILNIDEHRIPNQNSWAYDQIIEGITQNKIKGLWVIATNPAHSWINKNEFKDYRHKLDFLVVQDMYWSTETAQMADLILPAAGWGEKEGTFINSERRIGRIKQVADAPGAAMTDFTIFKFLAKYWGCDDLFEKWDSPASVFQILKEISKGQPCDISGIDDYQMIDDCNGVQWPLKEGEELTSNERRLFEDGQYYHANGKARFIFEDIRNNPEPTSDKYPFELLTGRGTSAQWHTQTRTSKSKILKKLYPKNVYIEMNPEDARKLNIRQGQKVFVATRRAKVSAHVSIIPTVAPKQIFMPMHYEETNELTYPAFDPYSRQPSYKTCAASITSNEYRGVT